MSHEDGISHVSPAENNRAWAATMEGRYREALQQWDAILARDQSNRGSITNRGITRVLVGDLEGALEDFLAVRHYPSLPIVQQEFIGVTLWLQGKQDAACEDWAKEIDRRRAGEFTHVTDDAGGVQIPALLWWASAHTNHRHWRKLAENELRRLGRTKRCQRSHWPGPLVPFLLGSISEEELAVAVLASYPPEASVVAARHRCQAHFYVGARALGQGASARYRQELTQTPGEEPSLVLQAEYHLAKAELQRLK